MKREKTWKILKRGRVPEQSLTVEFTCPSCGREAMLPVLGLPMAQIHGGIVFDIGDYAMPSVVQCRACRRVFEAANQRK